MLADVEGDQTQAQSLRQAMRIEGVDGPDIRDELALLARQFASRAPVWLREEVNRLYRQLRQWCGHCGRRAMIFDSQGTCMECVVAERRERRLS